MLHLCNQDNPANRGSGWIEFLNGGLGFVTSLSDWSTSTRPIEIVHKDHTEMFLIKLF